MTAQLFQTFPLRHSRLLAMGGWKNSEESLKANARNIIWPRELVLEIDIGVNILVTPPGRLMMAMYPELVFVKLSANDLVSVYGNINIEFLHVIQCCNTQNNFIQIIQKSNLINIKSDS